MTTTEPTTATTPTIGTREEWVRARRAARAGEGADPPERRAGPPASRAPVGARRRHLRVRHRARPQAALGALRRPVAADHLPLHVRTPLGRGLPELLVDHRSHRSPARPPRAPRRDVGRRVVGAARQAPRISRADGLDVPVGVVVDNDFNFDFRVSSTEERPLLEYNFRDVPDDAARRWPGRAARDERVRPPRRHRLPHVLDLRPGHGRMWGMYQWLDRAPLGRNEVAGASWLRRHDVYDPPK